MFSAPKELFPRRKDFFKFYWDLMAEVFGKEVFYENIFGFLDLCINGQCGVETTYFTYPALLLGKGKQLPDRSYVSEFGIPRSDGKEAATVEQRKVIYKTLTDAGYILKIPPWFNEDFTPNDLYWVKK